LTYPVQNIEWQWAEVLMNTFSIKIKEPAEEWLKKYDKNIQQRFANKIRKLKENPELHGKPLRKPLHGYWEIYFEKAGFAALQQR
jgi:ribosomal protein S17E